LPAVGLHLILSYTKKDFSQKILGRIIIYLPMIIFIAIAILKKNFIINGSCGLFFVSIKNYFHSGQNPMAELAYFLYYFGYIGIICFYLAYGINKERNKHQILIYLTILITTLLAILPPAILLFIFPAISYEFPSVYCQFAVLYAIFAILGVYWDDKKLDDKI